MSGAISSHPIRFHGGTGQILPLFNDVLSTTLRRGVQRLVNNELGKMLKIQALVA